MPVILSSTTDSPEEITRALESAGLEAEDVETFSNEPEPETPAADQPLTEQQTGDEAQPAAESETAEPTTQEHPAAKPEKKEKAFQKRIDGLTKERYDAQKLADERAARIEDLERQIEQSKPKLEPKAEAKPEAQPEPKVEPVPAEPKAEDFEDYAEFLRALTKFESAQTKIALRQEYEAKIQELQAELQKKEAGQQVQDERENRILESVAIGQQKYADWDEIAGKPETAEVKFSGATVTALEEMEPEQRADTTYYLVTHPEEAKTLFEATNHPADAAAPIWFAANRRVGRELARIEAAIAADTKTAPVAKTTAPAKPKPRVTQAPPPITPVRGSATVAGPKNPQEMTTKEFLEWRNRTLRQQVQ